MLLAKIQKNSLIPAEKGIKIIFIPKKFLWLKIKTLISFFLFF